MGMMESIAGVAMELKSAQVMQNYSVSLAEKVMDSQEQMASTIFNEMMPQQMEMPKGDFIDIRV
jgi:uncharacterized protein YijF (DUF1287 family)